MKLPELIEQVRKVYQNRPDLMQLVDKSAVDTLGLTMREVKVLAALLVTGNAREAQELSEVKPAPFEQTVAGLIERGLLEMQGDNLSFEPAMRQLRLQTPTDLERDGVEEVEGEPPSVKMILRPIREQVLWLVRSADTPTRGLARVYAYLYGGAYTKQTFGLLGLFVKELGRDQAALFLLEHAHGQYRNPLMELLPLARARAKGFRPADAPSEEEVNNGIAAVHRIAWEKRIRQWKKMLQAGEDPKKVGGRQYEEDMRLWNRLGRPSID